MNQGIEAFNEIINNKIIKDKKFLLKNPSYIKTFMRISSRIKKQEKIRKKIYKNEEIIVPPILIMSITNACNLTCQNCYACQQNRNANKEMSIQDIDRIIKEAVELGVGIIMIAGGEPLLKKGILDVIKQQKDVLFVMFTNGILLNDTRIETLSEIKNLVPIISLEGNKARTDERRGSGMYEKIMDKMDELKQKNRLFGASITLTSENFDEVLKGDYLESLENMGCGAAFLIEYVSSGDEDKALCITEAQKQYLVETEEQLYQKYNMLTVPLPGNEDLFGGCLASGRGFLHISSEGDLEACPFAPYSDTNVLKGSLKTALQSKLLKDIRENHHLLKETRNGCALIENKEWVMDLMTK